MMNQVVRKSVLVVGLILSAIAIPACQTTGKAQPEMLTGDTELTHERHASGIDSQTADRK